MLPIRISYKAYESFLSGGKVGLDAKTIYEHLLYIGIKENQNYYIVHTTEEILHKDLQLSRPRIRKAKQFLLKNELVEYKVQKNRKGVIERIFLNILPQEDME